MIDKTELPTFVSPQKNRPAAHTAIASEESSDPVDLPDNRYELIGLIASGGMGSVYRARDYVLQRDVAIKIIHDCFADAGNIHRFRDEATITGQLQHPGIPPIYDLGDLPDGKPFLAMKLVEGRTLETLISEDRAAVDVAGIFESIAQAVGYAHSRGVIHRDLKPSNVMVGSFGEVQVMDWGLAKVLGKSAPEEADRPKLTPGVSSRTVLGCAIGTPSYMPPEQATGSLDKVNAASDVFGLGGILCAMLTGRPTFGGTDADSTREQAAKGDLADAFQRLGESGAEPALIALAKQCLSADPAGRPADGNAVATFVATMRREADERAKQAHLSQAVARARGRVLNRAAAAVIVVLTAGIAVSFWQAKRAEFAEANTRDQLVKTQSAEAEAREKKLEAEDTLVVVADRTMLAIEAFSQLVASVQNKLEDRPGTQILRRELLEIGRKGLQKIISNAVQHPFADHSLYLAHMHLGDLELSLGDTSAAAREFRTGHDIILRLAKDGRIGSRYTHDLIVSYSRMGDISHKLGNSTEGRNHFERGHSLAVEYLSSRPGDKKAILYRNALASRLLDTGGGKESIAFYQRMLNDFKKLAENDSGASEYRRNLGAAHIKLGDALLANGQSEDALQSFLDGKAVFQSIFDVNGDYPERADDLCLAFGRIGDYYSNRNNWKEARNNYELQRNLSQRVSDADPKNIRLLRALAVSHEKLGTLTLAEGNRPEALKLFSRSAAILRQITEIDPNNQSVNLDLAIIYDKLGLAAHEGGQTAESLDYRQKAFDICTKLVELDPANAECRSRLSGACERLGETLLRLGRAADARRVFERLREMEVWFTKAKPEDVDHQVLLAGAVNRIGDASLALGERGPAAEYYRQALAIRNRLADRNPKDLKIRRELCISYNRLGNMAVEDGKLNEARDFFSRELAISTELHRDNPDKRSDHRDHAVSLERLGFICFKLGRWNEAREQWLNFQKEAFALAKADPTNGDYLRLFGLSSIRLGEVAHRLGEAELADAHFRKGIDLNGQLCRADPDNLTWALDRYSMCEKYALVYFDRCDLAKTKEWFTASRAAILPWHEKKKLTGPPTTYVGIMDGKIAHCQSIINGTADIDSIFRYDRSKITELVVDCLKVRLHRKDWDGALATAKRFASWAERQETNIDDHRYNAASVYAQCAVPDETGIERSLAILKQLKADGYFDAKRTAHIKKDGDFDGVRKHPKFIAFINALGPPREAAPPPREKVGMSR